jgi:hypothetical protein
MSENCYECGLSVAWGSGRFVNRVPADAPLDEDLPSCHVLDPDGEWICAECLDEGED